MMANANSAETPKSDQVGSLEAGQGKEQSVLKVRGKFDWRAAASAREILENPPLNIRSIDLSETTELDTVGALVLFRLHQRLQKAKFTNASQPIQHFIEQVSQSENPGIIKADSRTGFRRQAENTGEWVFWILKETRELVTFFGALLAMVGKTILHPRRHLRITSIVFHMHDVGVKALPITGMLAFLLGIVMAYQGADQLSKFGASLFVVNLLGISILRELGVIITSIIIAGRSGSAFTAQIGTMKVNQEVDAMETMGLDPMETLVLPRTIALVLTLPLVVFYANIIAIIGGAIMADISLGISFPQFIAQFNSHITINQFWVGMVKAPVFAFLIAMVGCFQGLRVTGSAESVGKQTTASVVQSIFLVITFDAVFSVIFSLLNV